MSRVLTRTITTIAEGFADQRGSINILFAFSLVPIIGMVGLSVDYGVGQAEKHKLDNAADAAAIAAVATAKAYVAANSSNSNATSDAIAAGLDRAGRAFNVNAGNIPFAQVPTPQITLARTNQTFAATVNYTALTTNHFGQLFGSPTMKLSGGSSATADIPSYLDFYLMIDVSGSMGLPTTNAGQSTLLQNFSCQFACHFPGQDQAYNYANANNIQLRSGAVNTAVCSLLTRASQEAVANQYRVGIYPFITRLGTLASLTTDIAGVNTAAGCTQSPQNKFTSLLDTGSTQLNSLLDPTTGVGSGGTHFDNAFQQLPSNVLHYGDGSTSNYSRPFVFLVTDGMQNSQYFWSSRLGAWGYPGNPSQYLGWGAANWTGSSPNSMDSSQCNTLKNAGATISILYIPYTVLTLTNQNQGETVAANNSTPQVPIALQQCATNSSYFYTANSPADINNALTSMFSQAVQVAHLTQ